MALLLDLALLACYGTSLVIYLFVTVVQVLNPSHDDRTSTLGAIMKIGLRMALATLFYVPVIGICTRILGYQLIEHSDTRRNMILDRVLNNGKSTSAPPGSPRGPQRDVVPSSHPPSKAASSLSEEPNPKGGSWEGIIGFFHPFCNAGGGGERVLWAAIKATQERHPRAICVVYTGDHDATKQQIIARVKDRFNIELDVSTLFFLYLSTRNYVLASTWPRFTLIGQSLGSVALAFDAFQLLVPDVFVDTMGYAFALGCARLLFPKLPTGAYVHYPTISTDMLGSLDMEEGKGLHAGAGTGWRGFAKKTYWRIFAWAYTLVGSTVDVVMTNSSWTQGHIRALWGSKRKNDQRKSEADVVFPPCAVEELEHAIKVDPESEAQRENALLYIAQFRPEKNHKLILRAFSDLVQRRNSLGKQNNVKLVLLGSVRDSEDATRVYELRLLAHELKIKEEVEFVCNASWPEILRWLQKASIGVNGMWNEHFGIGVVEYQAAGLISVVNDSGGPKLDIVVDYNGGSTGYHASTPMEYADAFEKALALSTAEKIATRKRARESAKRFSEVHFAKGWNVHVDRLLELQRSPPSASIRGVQVLASSYLLVLAYDLYQIVK